MMIPGMTMAIHGNHFIFHSDLEKTDYQCQS